MDDYKYEGTKYSVHDLGKHAGKGVATNYYIRIEEGPFAQVEYTYNKVMNRGLDDEDNFHLSFDYDVLYSPPHLPKVVQRDFEDVLWEILKDILIQTDRAIQAKEGKVEEFVVDELDTTVPDEFKPEEFVAKPESD